MMIAADAREIPLRDQCVHCVVTSPPYWGLRDYGLPGQLGLERTPQLYLAEMRKVFREVWRVLRDDGTAWVNLGDCYAADKGFGGDLKPSDIQSSNRGSLRGPGRRPANRLGEHGLKPKDLCGIPWRLAFALQEDGWYLRSDIIWSKPNPMPESVTDRPTKSHEYVFLLAKQESYFYDRFAVAEQLKRPEESDRKTPARFGGADKWEEAQKQSRLHSGNEYRGTPTNTRNLRSVWNIATQPYAGAHFATFPEKLVEPCIRAGSSAKGVCRQCGAPWERVTRSAVHFEGGSGKALQVPSGWRGERTIPEEKRRLRFGKHKGTEQAESGDYDIRMGPVVESQTIGWRPTCLCRNQHGKTARAIVLDPFGGSGTVGRVATRLGRQSILLDIGYRDKYAPLVKERNSRVQMELTCG